MSGVSWHEVVKDHLAQGRDRTGTVRITQLGTKAARSDLGAHDPPPLRDFPYPHEAVLRIQLLRSCVQIGATLRRPLLGLLRIGLDDAAAGPLDLVERRRDRSGGDALAAVLRVGEDAADPPVRRIIGLSIVGTPVLDIGEFRRRAELAPADTAVTVVDEHPVDRSARHVPALRLPVSIPGVAGTDALRVESHTPAATPHAVVDLNQRAEAVPGLRRKHPSRECHTGSVTDWSDKARLTATGPWGWLGRTREASHRGLKRVNAGGAVISAGEFFGRMRYARGVADEQHGGGDGCREHARIVAGAGRQ